MDDNRFCLADSLPNHAALAVGYHIDLNNPNNIWVKFKNSWGKDWGEDGYFRLAINNNLDNQNDGPCNMLKWYDEVAWAHVP